MPPKINPLKLNPLQAKTLTLLQELARYPELSTTNVETGEVFIANLPKPHGNHFHIGSRVALAADATGFSNQAVWVALERKGLIKSTFPFALTLTQEGQSYETGLADKILHGSDH